MPRSFLTVAALVAAVVTLGAGSASAIQFGEPDGNRHPWVGLVVFFDETDTPFLRCSGSLLSPTTFLTAGHCAGPDASSGTPQPAFARIWFDEGPIPVDPTFPGGSCGAGGPYTGYPCAGYDAAGTPVAHPGWNGVLTLPNSSDVGVVKLTEAPSLPSSYGKLAPVGYVDQFAKQGRPSASFTVVGYGVQQWKPSIVASLQRVRGTVGLVNLTNAHVRDWGIQITGSPGKGKGPGGICYGDSGGPLLHDGPGGEVIVGVTSFVISPNCTGPAGAYRIDTAYAQGFIANP